MERTPAWARNVRPSVGVPPVEFSNRATARSEIICDGTCRTASFFRTCETNLGYCEATVYTDLKGRLDVRLARVLIWLRPLGLGSMVGVLLCFSPATLLGRFLAVPQGKDTGVCSGRPTPPASRTFVPLRLEPPEKVWTPTVSVLELTLKVPRGARKAFKKALEYLGKSRPKEARQQLNKALKIEPKYFQASTALAVLLFNSRDYTAARRHARQAQQIDPWYLPALEVLGATDAVDRKYSRAVEELSEVVRLAPSRAAAHHYLGVALLQQNRCAEGFQHLEMAFKLQSDPPPLTPLWQTGKPLLSPSFRMPLLREPLSRHTEGG